MVTTGRRGPESGLREDVFKAMEELGGMVIEIPYTKGINSSALADNLKSIGTTPRSA